MIRIATPQDAIAVAQLAVQMWTSGTEAELAAEFESLMAKPDAVIFLYDVGSESIGFAQCQLRRDYVEGTETSPVGYLEGVFVKKAYRNRGYGKALVSACEGWATEQGCAEFASDCQLDNLQSLAFHLHSGFAEANRIICFTKKLSLSAEKR